MKSRNLLGLAALLILLAAVFGGSLLCQPASERTTIPTQADRWREQPASARGEASGAPVRSAAEATDSAAVHDLVARVADQDGRPILGAEVFLNWVEKPGAAAAARAYTGLDGSVRFERLPRARFRLQAIAEGFFPSAGTEEVTIPTPVLQEVELRLERGGSVSGFVYGLDGFEVPFAWIRLRDLDTGMKTLARADERGAFRSTALKRGAWEVAWVEHEQAEPDPRIVWSAVIEPGDHVELVVTLERAERGERREGRAVGIALLRRGE